MKIFYICADDLGRQAAWRTHVIEVIKNLNQLGHEVILFAPIPGKDINSNSINHVWVPVIDLRIVGDIFFYFALFFYLIYCQLKEKAEIVYMRDIGWSMTPFLFCKMFRLRHVLEVNGIIEEEHEAIGNSKLKIKLLDCLQRFNFAKADKIVTVSQSISNYLIEKYNLPASKLNLIQNGVNSDLFRPIVKHDCRSALGLDQDKYYLMFVGSFYPHHGVEQMLRLMKRITEKRNDVFLLLVGEGYTKHSMMELSAKLGISEFVQFVGEVQYSRLPLYLNSSDLCVYFMTSKLKKDELLSIKMFEYMACEKPLLLGEENT